MSYLASRNVSLFNSTFTASTFKTSVMSYSTMVGSTITTSSIVTPAIVGTVIMGQNATYPNRYLEVGTDATNSMYLDFHSNDATLPDYSTRIQSYGGATSGTGTLAMYGSTIGLVPLGSVGVGTTTPTGSLHLFGTGVPTLNISNTTTVNYSQQGSIGFNFGGGSTGTTNSFQIISQTVNRDNGAGPNYDYGAQCDLVFQRKTNNLYSNATNDKTYTEVMRLGGATGYVGIGTTNPTSLLTLTSSTIGNILAINGYSNTAITFNDSLHGYSSAITQKGQSTSDCALQFYNSSAGILSTSPIFIFLNTSTSSVLIILNNGNVGISTNAPSALLHIYGSSNTANGLAYVNSSSQLSSTVNSYDIIQRWNESTIGNANYVDLMWIRTSAGSDWTTSGQRFQAKTDATWQGFIEFNGINNNYGVTIGTGSSNSNPNSVPGVLYVKSGGNVGIGTTNPSGQLHIYSTTADRSTSLIVNTMRAGIYLQSNGTGGSQWNIWSSLTGESPGGGALCFYDQTNTAWRMVINSSGNVGIGTNNPAYTLDVNGTSRFTNTVNISGANCINFGYDVSGKESNAGKMGYQTFTAGCLDIVGAGTSTRSVKIWDNLTVPGTIYAPTFSGSLYMSSAETYQTVGVQIINTSSGTAKTFQFNVAGSSGWGTVGTLGIYNGPAGSFSMCIAPSGNVGVNTLSPGTTFHVAGTNGAISSAIMVSNASAADVATKTLLSTYSNASVMPSSSGTSIYLYCSSGTTVYRYILAASTFFTGQHANEPLDPILKTNIQDYVGMIVSSADQGYYSINPVTKEITTGVDAITITEALPYIALTETDKDPAVWGVLTNVKNDSVNTDGSVPLDNDANFGDRLGSMVRVNGLGEGAVWVTNINGPIRNGDLICSSVITGYGRKQDDDLFHNYTVAKATMSCSFDTTSTKYKTRTIEHNGTTYIAAFVGCSYHCS